jgi:RHS repeat-associated protein
MDSTILSSLLLKDYRGNVIKLIDYVYDTDNRRIAKIVDVDGAGVAPATVERFVYDGQNIILTFDGNGNQGDRYLHGAGVDQSLADEKANGAIVWALTDHQGTVRDLVDLAGVVQNHITYDSYGNITGQTNPVVTILFAYTGREFDTETGQYYYRARYYDPTVGRFISEDLIGFDGGDTNLYRYVGNSPTFFVDPLGLCPCDPSIWGRLRNAAVGAASGAAAGAATGAAVGAGVGALAGGVGALPGAGAGATAGAIGGGLSGLLDDPCANLGDVAKRGAIDGAIGGALGGGGAVLSKAAQIARNAKLLKESTAMYSEVKLFYSGGQLVLQFDYDRNGSIYRSGIKFNGVIAHRHRSDPLCTAWHIEEVYDILAEIQRSSWLYELQTDARQNENEYPKSFHYMIYLDGSGCYEIVAGSWEALLEEEGAWQSTIPS